MLTIGSIKFLLNIQKYYFLLQNHRVNVAKFSPFPTFKRKFQLLELMLERKHCTTKCKFNPRTISEMHTGRFFQPHLEKPKSNKSWLIIIIKKGGKKRRQVKAIFDQNLRFT